MLNKHLYIFLAIGLSACTHPGFQQSGIEPPSNWNSARHLHDNAPLVVDNCAVVEQLWWKHFNDQTLDELIVLAIENNKTLGIATTRVEEARAARLSAWATLLPLITLNADASTGNQGFYTAGDTLYFDDLSVQASWELDLFGKNQARLDAANSIVQAEYIARQAVLVGLLAEIGRNYFDMRNFERQLLITKQNVDSQRRTYELTVEQLNGGLASNFDVQRAAAQVSTTEARIPVLRISYEATRNRLNVLLGATPGQYDALYQTEESFEPLDQKIIVAAPATVLATRPDVRAAERRFAASISEHEAAAKEWFPTISLTGFFGFQDMTLFNTAPTWNVAANLVQPLINFGRIESRIEATDARQMRAFLEYQQTILQSLEEMENALVSYLYETKRNYFLSNAAEQNRTAMDLADQQYTNGYSGLLDVLIVQRNVLETESAKAESDAKLRKDLVNIYTASGGGWQI